MKRTILTCNAAAIADRAIVIAGDWEVLTGSLQHKVITNTLDDTLSFQFSGSSCDIVMGSATNKRIAVVVRFNDQSIPTAVAGIDLAHDEDQSYLLIDEIRPYNIYRSTKATTGKLSIVTRSNKLICKSIVMRGENE